MYLQGYKSQFFLIEEKISGFEVFYVDFGG